MAQAIRSFIAVLFLVGLSFPAFSQVTVGTYGSTSASGWSTFVAKTITTGTCAGLNANGTCIWYVSTTDGTDNSGCISSNTVNTPCKTFGFLMTQMFNAARNGTADWILMKKGDTFNEIISDDGVGSGFVFFGMSDTFPMVIGAYDKNFPGVVNPATGGARPKFNVPSNGVSGLGCNGGLINSGCNDVALVGIELYAFQGDPNVTGRATVQANTALGLGNPMTFFLVEDCKFSFFGLGVLPQAIPASFIMRRSVIQYMWSQGMEGGGGSPSANEFIIEENVIDSSGNITITGPATITPGNPTLVTYANGFFSGDRNTTVTFSPGCTGITAGTPYYVYSNNFSTFNISSSPSSNVAVNSTGCSTTTQTLTWVAVPALPTGHNMYIGGINPPGVGAFPSTVRGNIVSRDPVNSQIRSGGTITDNAWLNNATSHNWGNPASVPTTTISNNIYLSGQELGCGCGNFATATMGSDYLGDAYDQGTTIFTGNIAANAISGSPQAFASVNGFSVNWTSNIVYNWGPGPNGITDGSNNLPNTAGITAVTITNPGSGYTDFVMNVTALGTDGTLGAGFGLAKVTVSNVNALANNKGSAVYITGLGGGGCAINNTVVTTSVQHDGANTVTLSVPVGTCTFSAGAKLYWPVDDGIGTHYGVFGATNTAPQSGSGSGATIMAISALGQIVSVWLSGADSGVFGARDLDPGKGYAINDTETATIPGGSGLVFKVTAVSTNTIGAGNQLFPAGPAQGGWSNPSITAGSYYDTVIGSGGHTTADFINAAAAMHKDTWDPRLTANNGLNPAVRTAFGVSGGVACPGCVRGLNRNRNLWLLWRDIQEHSNDNTPAFLQKAG